MRKLAWLISLALLGVAAGCADSIEDGAAPGPVAPHLYHEALLVNQQRLAGEDHRVVPLYKTPVKAMGVGFDDVFGKPFAKFWDYMTRDTAAVAVDKMTDIKSADARREGILRLVDFPFARQGFYIKGYYMITQRDTEDYTVRAAGLRALNRCRAKGYTLLLMRDLNDDNPLVRLEAADALGNIPDPTAVDLVRLLIIHMSDQESNLDVRVACADALRNFHTTEAMRALANVLDSPEFSVAWQARQSLELLTSQDFRYNTNAWLNYISTAAMSG